MDANATFCAERRRIQYCREIHARMPSVKIEVLGTIENADDDNVDVLLHLDDGRIYSFLVSTPKGHLLEYAE
jgi:hypothetical protein